MVAEHAEQAERVGHARNAASHGRPMLDGQVALVTGAGSGIGKSAAMALASAGAHVVLADIDVSACEKTAAELDGSAGRVLAVPCDVRKRADIASLVSLTVDTFGQLDCAFNNAGVAGRGERAVHEADEDDFDDVLATNLKGVWLCMKHELAPMLKRGRGAIVNGASVASLVAFDRLGAYVASKHGILGLTKSAALEYADKGIRVNAVCPGVVRTPFTERFIGGSPEAEAGFLAVEPTGRMATPEEVATAVVWLCSDQASFVTGHGLVVDGGLTAR